MYLSENKTRENFGNRKTQKIGKLPEIFLDKNYQWFEEGQFLDKERPKIQNINSRCDTARRNGNSNKDNDRTVTTVGNTRPNEKYQINYYKCNWSRNTKPQKTDLEIDDQEKQKILNKKWKQKRILT